MAGCCAVTLSGFCLNNGTPIGVVVLNGIQTGWINFETGITTPGPVPAGTAICAQSIDEPVSVDAVDFDIRNLLFATDKVDISGSTGVGVTGPLTDAELRATPPPVDPVDDYDTFEAQHVVLVGSTDTTITFSSAVRLVRISNWDTVNRILAKDGSISSDSDVTAARVGKAPAADVPGQMYFPFATTTIHVRSAVGSEVTVEGYKGSV